MRPPGSGHCHHAAGAAAQQQYRAAQPGGGDSLDAGGSSGNGSGVRCGVGCGSRGGGRGVTTGPRPLLPRPLLRFAAAAATAVTATPGKGGAGRSPCRVCRLVAQAAAQRPQRAAHARDDGGRDAGGSSGECSGVGCDREGGGRGEAGGRWSFWRAAARWELQGWATALRWSHGRRTGGSVATGASTGTALCDHSCIRLKISNAPNRLAL